MHCTRMLGRPAACRRCLLIAIGLSVVYGAYYVSVDSITGFIAHEVDDQTVLGTPEGTRPPESALSPAFVSLSSGGRCSILMPHREHRQGLRSKRRMCWASPFREPMEARLAEVCRPL